MTDGPFPSSGGPRFRQTNRADRPSRFMLFVRRHKRGLRTLGGLAFLGIAGGVFLKIHGAETILNPLAHRVEALIPLKITAINVEGANLTSAAAVQSALGVSTGDPMLEFDAAAARQRLDDLPFVDHASVERHLSGLIVVRLTERPPFVVWQHQGKFLLIDRSGNPVPDKGMTGKDARAFMQLPLVVGDGADAAAPELIDALDKAPDVKSRMVAATLIGKRRWTLTLKDGTEVYLPEAEEAPAVIRLEELHKRFGLLDRPVEIIDMRLPDRMTIRERSDPAAKPDGTPAVSDDKDGEKPSRGSSAPPRQNGSVDRQEEVMPT